MGTGITYIFPYLPHQSVKGIVHSHSCLCRGFNEGDAIVPENSKNLIVFRGDAYSTSLRSHFYFLFLSTTSFFSYSPSDISGLLHVNTPGG